MSIDSTDPDTAETRKVWVSLKSASLAKSEDCTSDSDTRPSMRAKNESNQGSAPVKAISNSGATWPHHTSFREYSGFIGPQLLFEGV